MADILMYSPNDIALNESNNQNLLKVHKVVKPTNEKTLGTSVIYSPMSPTSLFFYQGGRRQWQLAIPNNNSQAIRDKTYQIL